MNSPSVYTGPAPVVSGYIPDFERAMTTAEYLVFGLGGAGVYVPQGEYWRVIAGSTGYTTDVAVSNRLLSFTAVDPAATSVLNIRAPALQPANCICYYTFGPLLASYSNTADNLNQGQQFPIPDVIWPGGYRLSMAIGLARPLDTWGTSPYPNFLIEHYLPIAPSRRRRAIDLPRVTPILL